MQEQLSQGEIERMRQILKTHDAQQAPLKTIDLNNPPKEPYRFQAFPKMVYDHENSTLGHIVQRVVRSDDELESALASGYSKEAPAYGNSPEDTLSPHLRAEAEQVQAQIDEKRGRKAKAA